MTVNVAQLKIPGCYEIQLPVYSDVRGMLVKSFSYTHFSKHLLEVGFVETFYTISGENVLRGMHLQVPPADHAKLVYCVTGNVLDVCLDVRRGSPTFGEHISLEISASRKNALYLPRGVAHGFYVQQAPAVMIYHVTSEHQPQFDCGIVWNSFGAEWPTQSPVLSLRDASLPRLKDFSSPFLYTPTDDPKELK